jgi:hypothetical protein
MACAIGAYVDWRSLLAILALMVASIFYNSSLIRIKNSAHWDYLLEALNAPLRGILGWIVADPSDSNNLYQVLAAYYFISLNVMLLKRRFEIELFRDPNQLKKYRPSLTYYTSTTLNVLSLISLFCGIFFSCWALIF